jgi:hypothetical protein
LLDLSKLTGKKPYRYFAKWTQPIMGEYSIPPWLFVLVVIAMLVGLPVGICYLLRIVKSATK